MSNAAIKAALEAAVTSHTVDAWTLEDEHRAWLVENMAGAIAAFFLALPPGWHMDKTRDEIAAAVERAARESTDGP